MAIERDDHGSYPWCPELKGCQSQGATLDEAMANEILTTSIEVNA